MSKITEAIKENISTLNACKSIDTERGVIILSLEDIFDLAEALICIGQYSVSAQWDDLQFAHLGARLEIWIN